MNAPVNLSSLSADQLDRLAIEARTMAGDLRQRQPSYKLAIRAGVRDRSYQTVANGYVRSYAGEAVVTLEDGSQWRCVGHPPAGDAYSISTLSQQGHG